MVVSSVYQCLGLELTLRLVVDYSKFGCRLTRRHVQQYHSATAGGVHSIFIVFLLQTDATPPSSQFKIPRNHPESIVGSSVIPLNNIQLNNTTTVMHKMLRLLCHNYPNLAVLLLLLLLLINLFHNIRRNKDLLVINIIIIMTQTNQHRK